MKKLFLTALAVTFCAMLPAQAQVMGLVGPPDSPVWLQCKGTDTFYMASSPDMPPHVAEVFAGHGASLVVRACDDHEGHAHYFVRAPADAGKGVCRFSEGEMFPRTAESRFTMPVRDPVTPRERLELQNWEPLPPREWAARQYTPWQNSFAYIESRDGETCPPINDVRYFQAKHVTDGLLGSFGAFWRDASASPEAFDRAFANIADLQTRTALREQTFNRHPAISGMWCVDGSEGAGGGCTATIGGYWINFDAGVRGLVISGVAAVPVI